MTNDKEELKLAAKAGGIKLLFDPTGVPRDCTGMDPLMNIFAAKPWNSLEDDGDAFRLAVKLNMNLDVIDGSSGAQLLHVVWCSEPHHGNPLAATRRAITRAAAAIGKDMPTPSCPPLYDTQWTEVERKEMESSKVAPLAFNKITLALTSPHTPVALPGAQA